MQFAMKKTWSNCFLTSPLLPGELELATGGRVQQLAPLPDSDPLHTGTMFNATGYGTYDFL